MRCTIQLNTLYYICIYTTCLYVHTSLLIYNILHLTLYTLHLTIYTILYYIPYIHYVIQYDVPPRLLCPPLPCTGRAEHGHTRGHGEYSMHVYEYRCVYECMNKSILICCFPRCIRILYRVIYTRILLTLLLL